MRKLPKLLVVLFAGAALLAATTTTHKKKSTQKTSSKKSSSRKTTSSRKKRSSKKTSWRNTQKTPTPERYKEIQQALASKGYPIASTGVWDTSSVEALKKFQEDQNLQPSGKIDSISLIALGLGPRRDQPAPPQP